MTSITLAEIEQAIHDLDESDDMLAASLLLRLRDHLQAGAVILSKEDRQQVMQQAIEAGFSARTPEEAQGHLRNVCRLLKLEEQ